VGNLWFEMALECSDKWPDWPESATRAEMRAAAKDLRHTAEFLLCVGHERNVSSLGLEDERLSLMADRWAVDADRIAAEITALLTDHTKREDG
jgi:DNA-binding SARP family transcriptional activator